MLGHGVVYDLGEVLVLPISTGETHQAKTWWE